MTNDNQPAMSVGTASAILASEPNVEEFVEYYAKNMIPNQDHDAVEFCQLSAAWLIQSGELDSIRDQAMLHVVGMQEHEAKRWKRKFRKDARASAVSKLQGAKILPTAGFSISCIGWLLLRFIVLPFLGELIQRYMDDNWDLGEL